MKQTKKADKVISKKATPKKQVKKEVKKKEPTTMTGRYGKERPKKQKLSGEWSYGEWTEINGTPWTNEVDKASTEVPDIKKAPARKIYLSISWTYFKLFIKSLFKKDTNGDF